LPGSRLNAWPVIISLPGKDNRPELKILPLVPRLGNILIVSKGHFGKEFHLAQNGDISLYSHE